MFSLFTGRKINHSVLLQFTFFQTLAECTKEMDATTWNTYHIISDRSRSVCYGVRQQQFQRQTRFAVNQLAATASDQLNVMQNLRVSSDDLWLVINDKPSLLVRENYQAKCLTYMCIITVVMYKAKSYRLFHAFWIHILWTVAVVHHW